MPRQRLGFNPGPSCHRLASSLVPRHMLVMQLNLLHRLSHSGAKWGEYCLGSGSCSICAPEADILLARRLHPLHSQSISRLMCYSGTFIKKQQVHCTLSAPHPSLAAVMPMHVGCMPTSRWYLRTIQPRHESRNSPFSFDTLSATSAFVFWSCGGTVVIPCGTMV